MIQGLRARCTHSQATVSQHGQTGNGTMAAQLKAGARICMDSRQCHNSLCYLTMPGVRLELTRGCPRGILGLAAFGLSHVVARPRNAPDGTYGYRANPSPSHARSHPGRRWKSSGTIEGISAVLESRQSPVVLLGVDADDTTAGGWAVLGPGVATRLGQGTDRTKPATHGPTSHAPEAELHAPRAVSDAPSSTGPSPTNRTVESDWSPGERARRAHR
jgi:hypothetical protein